jgi:hypothetical protein
MVKEVMLEPKTIPDVAKPTNTSSPVSQNVLILTKT